MTEAELGEQMLALFDSLRVESDEFREEFREGLRKSANWDLGGARKRGDDLRQRHAELSDRAELHNGESPAFGLRWFNGYLTCWSCLLRQVLYLRRFH
jgi:hypothetical protein